MLCQLPSSHDNVQNMVIYHSCMNMLRQLSSSHDNGQSMMILLKYESCSVSCNGQSMVIYP